MGVCVSIFCWCVVSVFMVVVLVVLCALCFVFFVCCECLWVVWYGYMSSSSLYCFFVEYGAHGVNVSSSTRGLSWYGWCGGVVLGSCWVVTKKKQK